MKENEIHFRHLILFYFLKAKNAAQTAKKKCAVYEDGVLAESTVRMWFTRFRAENYDLEYRQCSGRPTVVDNEQIKITHVTQRETSQRFSMYLRCLQLAEHDPFFRSMRF
ncbi:histone-lysine N-methyltransferase SETMAR-like [Octopus sinensis]|uniref:Histone-lysine N-methyltransferase SETMAR-like n=1 Tax=Octopus sinensis TaxID=2607531 RepID=A0A6P7TRB2_9MOLL|nr:histone-lysine N-methyltransferase SETMAR-like [Octopus sinensis]